MLFTASTVVPLRFVGGKIEDLPHPGIDWHIFQLKIKDLNHTVPPVFCPISNAVRPWVDINKLNATYRAEHSPSSVTCAVM